MTASDETLARVVRALETAYTDLATLAETTDDVPPEFNAAREAIGDLLIRLQTAALARTSGVERAAISDGGGRVRLRIKALKPKQDDVSTAIIPLTAVALDDHTDARVAQVPAASAHTANQTQPVAVSRPTASLIERLQKVQPVDSQMNGIDSAHQEEPVRPAPEKGVLARDAQVRLAQLEAELDRFSRALASPVRQQPATVEAGADTRARPVGAEPVTDIVIVKRTDAVPRVAPPEPMVAPRDASGTASDGPDEATVEIRGGRRRQPGTVRGAEPGVSGRSLLPALRRSKD